MNVADACIHFSGDIHGCVSHFYIDQIDRNPGNHRTVLFDLGQHDHVTGCEDFARFTDRNLSPVLNVDHVPQGIAEGLSAGGNGAGCRFSVKIRTELVLKIPGIHTCAVQCFHLHQISLDGAVNQDVPGS